MFYLCPGDIAKRLNFYFMDKDLNSKTIDELENISIPVLCYRFRVRRGSVYRVYDIPTMAVNQFLQSLFMSDSSGLIVEVEGLFNVG